MSDQKTPVHAQFYIDVVLAIGACVWISAGLQHSFRHGALFWACLVVGLFAATLKVRLPGIDGTFSLGFVGSLVAIQELDFAEAVVVGTLVGVTQCFWKPARRPLAIQVAFNAANLANSTAIAYCAYRGGVLNDSNNCALLLLSAATLFYVVNTGTVAGVLCLLERKSLAYILEQWCLWSFSYYLAGALLAMFLQSIAGLPLVPLALVPLLFIAHIVYRAYVGRLAEPDRHNQSLTGQEKYHLYGR
jgi:hypothetical protein